jgi:hypothetical protein
MNRVMGSLEGSCGDKPVWAFEKVHEVQPKMRFGNLRIYLVKRGMSVKSIPGSKRPNC